MKFLKVVVSNESPNIKDVLWLKPVDKGFTLFYPENGWKPLKMENVSEGNYEQAGAADSVKKALVGKSSDSSKSMTLNGLKRYIDEQIASIE